RSAGRTATRNGPPPSPVKLPLPAWAKREANRRTSEPLADVAEQRPSIPAAARHRLCVFDHRCRVGTFLAHLAKDRPPAGAGQHSFRALGESVVATAARLAPEAEPLAGDTAADSHTNLVATGGQVLVRDLRRIEPGGKRDAPQHFLNRSGTVGCFDN